jgi:O-antigen ligase
MSSAVAFQPEATPTAKGTRPVISSARLLAGAGAVLLSAPLAFGAVEPWAIFALEASATLLFLAWGFRQWLKRELQIISHPLHWPMLAFAGLITMQWLAGMTAYRQATYSLLLLYLSYGLLVFVVTQTLRRTSQLEIFAWVLCGYSAVLASLSLLLGLAPNGKLYGIWKPDFGGAYGPYVNHNHYAGLMEMLTPFLLVLAATHLTRGARKVTVAVIAAVMAGSIFLCGSRGGMLAFGFQAVLLIVLLRPRQEDWKRHLLLGGCLAAMIGLLVWIGGNELTRRLASIQSETQQELTGGVRLSIDRDCLRMWREKPWLGWGLGTFPVVYPQFRSFYTSFFVNEAHNDYLQVLTETGLAGFAIAIWFLVRTFRHGWAKLDNWTESTNGALTVAALLGCIGILVHSFLDFNLQVPANAAMFYVLCAIAASNPLQESQRRRARRHHSLILEPQPAVPEEGKIASL